MCEREGEGEVVIVLHVYMTYIYEHVYVRSMYLYHNKYENIVSTGGWKEVIKHHVQQLITPKVCCFIMLSRLLFFFSTEMCSSNSAAFENKPNGKVLYILNDGKVYSAQCANKLLLIQHQKSFLSQQTLEQ